MIILEYVLSELARALPFPKRDANKYTRGKLTVVGGSSRYPGAASLAATAAQAMGAGYVEVICAPQSVGTIRAQRPSLVVASWEGFSVSSMSCSGDASASMHPEAVLVGSGFSGHDAFEADLVYRILQMCQCPVIIDGAAISAMATAQGIALCRARAERKLLTVVTPHMGEAARLAAQLRVDAPSPNAAEGSLARFAYALAEGSSSAVVLKGATTLIAVPVPGKDEIYAMRLGTSALAKAGSGDVLAGMISSVLAQRTDILRADPAKACTLAATLHAIAGREAAEKKTDISVVPEDLVDNIHNAIRYILEFA